MKTTKQITADNRKIKPVSPSIDKLPIPKIAANTKRTITVAMFSTCFIIEVLKVVCNYAAKIV